MKIINFVLFEKIVWVFFVEMIDGILWIKLFQEENVSYDKWWKMEHNAATVCYLYSEKFNSEDRIFRKVRDHCHYTGKNENHIYQLLWIW